MAAVPADYSITLTLEVLKPISEVSSINTDAQTVKIVNENEKTVTLEIQVRPLTDQLTHLQPNPNWRTEYSQTPSLQEYLRPRLTTNWDQSMRAELVQALVEDGIYPDQLNDVDLVKKVSSWIQRRFKYVDHFVSFDVDFSTGTAVVDPALRPHFDFEKVKNGFSTDEEALAKGVFGKSMFQARLRGNCTMTATLQATVLKALGIPTTFGWNGFTP
jgi:transglutaminase-like putative cysteine protease